MGCGGVWWGGVGWGRVGCGGVEWGRVWWGGVGRYMYLGSILKAYSICTCICTQCR